MGLSEIKKEIADAGKLEISKIRKLAEAEISAIDKEIEKITTEISEKAEEELQAKLKQIEEIKLAEAHSESTNILLSKKRELVDEALALALQELRKRDNRKYLERLISKAKQEVDIGTIICNKDDINLVKKMTDKDVRAGNITGGIIAVSKDESVSVDLSYDAILAGIREARLGEIIKALLSKDGSPKKEGQGRKKSKASSK